MQLVRLLALLTLLCGTEVAQSAANPISIHPENPKYFLFRDKPIVLITGTEHYGAVQNRRVDYVKYLEDTADKRITLSRLFLLFREQQSSRNPYSTLKIESPDFITPYPRTGPGKALDGEPKYDLDQWNPEFFERLHGFLSLASEKGVIIEVVLFSNAYAQSVFSLGPFNAANNLQGIGNVQWGDYLRGSDKDLLDRQIAFTRRIVQETCRYDNIYYEICNEPGGDIPGMQSVEDVNNWQERIGTVIRKELASAGTSHLVAGQEAFTYSPQSVPQLDDGPNWPHVFPYDMSFHWNTLDIVNVHPLPNCMYGGKSYQMGRFMDKELKLKALQQFTLATYPEKKPLVHDEDNAATMYLDDDGWTIHRKRAWTTVLCGAHYDAIDFSIIAGREAGSEESNRKIRTWYKHLSEFIHSFDFVHAAPLTEFVEGMPDHVLVSTLAIPGNDYAVYLADSRELTDERAGDAIESALTFRLPKGRYTARLYSPVTGLYSPGITVTGGDQPIQLHVPEFRHDVVLRVTHQTR